MGIWSDTGDRQIEEKAKERDRERRAIWNEEKHL